MHSSKYLLFPLFHIEAILSSLYDPKFEATLIYFKNIYWAPFMCLVLMATGNTKKIKMWSLLHMQRRKTN